MLTENSGIRLIFGLKLRALRQEQGLNYQQLSKATGVAVSYLHDIENGKKYPKADKIIALAKALKVDYDYLVSLTANKKLQPIIDFMSSDVTTIVPWEHFGITPATLLNVFANMSDKITAFLSTIIKRSQTEQLSKENFYTAALRSYQDLHDNYFPQLEESLKKFRSKSKLKDKMSLTVEELDGLLKKLYKIEVDREELDKVEELQSIRSYYSAKKKVLYINKGLSPAQEKFLLGRELAFQFLKLKPRPFETIVQSLASFEVLKHNFDASYFSNALLIPEDKIIEDLQLLFGKNTWTPSDWINLAGKYDVTAESLMQRLGNILPGHFGIDQLFFLRISSNLDTNRYDLTKELYLSQLHNPYTHTSSEHYCRRWVSIDIMSKLKRLSKKTKIVQPIVRAQISNYWQTHNSYFCFTIAKPQANDPNTIVSVTLGLLLDQKLRQKIPFVNHPSIPEVTVHTTCERCSISDCKERAAPPTVVDYFDNVNTINKKLAEFNK